MSTASEQGAPAALKWLSERVALGQTDIERLEKVLSVAENEQITQPPGKDGTDFDKVVAIAKRNLEDAEDRHLKLLRYLRDFDKSVAPEKRDTTESITREEGAKVFRMFAIYMRAAVESFTTSFAQDVLTCETPAQVYKLSADKLQECFENSIQGAIREAHLPLWSKEAIE